jgi:hypothetical protein
MQAGRQLVHRVGSNVPIVTALHSKAFEFLMLSVYFNGLFKGLHLVAAVADNGR